MHRAVVWFGCLCATTAASAAPPSEALTFARALGIAEQLPSIVVAREAATVERANVGTRGWLPLAVRLAPVLRAAPAADRGLEGTVSVEQAIPLGDLRAARREVQALVARQHLARAQAATLEARLEIAARWIAGWSAAERLAAAERDRELGRALVAIGDRARAAGTLTEPERADLRAFQAEVELRYLDAEGALTEAMFATGRGLGRSIAIRSEGALPAPELPPSTSWAQLVARVRSSPAATARRIAARVSLARAAEERASRRPQLVVGGWVGRDAPAGWISGVSIGGSLPHDRGDRETRTAEVSSRLAEAEATELAARAVLELAAALHEVEHTQEILTAIATRLVPATDSAATQRQRAFEVGEATVVEVIAARRAANSAHIRETEARAAHAWARIRAWLLIETTEEK